MGGKEKKTYVSRGEHELCMSTTYDRTAELDTIGRFVLDYEGGGSPTDVDDCGARLEESEGLCGFFAGLWDDEHDTYEGGIGQDTILGVIGLHSSGRTRGGGLLEVRLGIRGSMRGNGGYHAEKLYIVVHCWLE